MVPDILKDKSAFIMILGNFRKNSSNGTASHPRRMESSATLLWESQPWLNLLHLILNSHTNLDYLTYY